MNVSRAGASLQVDLDDEADADRLGRAVAGALLLETVIALVGPLGAGKTRLSRAIAEALGVDPLEIASPTFVLIHEYEGRIPVYHFDVYRLTSPAEFEDLGPADYWRAGGVCLVEWADRVPELLPDDAWWITLEPVGPTRRRVRIAVPNDENSTLDRLETLLSRDQSAPPSV